MKDKQLREQVSKLLPLPIVSNEEIEETFERFGKSLKKKKRNHDINN